MLHALKKQGFNSASRYRGDTGSLITLILKHNSSFRVKERLRGQASLKNSWRRIFTGVPMSSPDLSYYIGWPFPYGLEYSSYIFTHKTEGKKLAAGKEE